MTNEIVVIDGGSKQYWADRREAWALIRELERRSKIAHGSSSYIAGNWDDEYGDYEPVENLGPWDALMETANAVLANPTAMSIMNAQGRHPYRV